MIANYELLEGKARAIAHRMELKNLELEIVKDHSIDTAQIQHKVSDGNLKCHLRLGRFFENYNSEEVLGHEFGHVKYALEHPRIDSLLSKLETPLYLTEKRFGVRKGTLIYSAATATSVVAVHILNPFFMLVPLIPLCAGLISEEMAKRTAQKYGVSSY